MKELSIEEKAQRYDKAIERAKKVLLDCTPEEQKVVEYISPELKESEDERIRKEIIAILQYKYENYSKDPKYCNALKWIAWLEKQGEHANFRNKIQIGDKVTRNEDGVLVNLSQLKRIAKKQGEQEHVITPKFRIGDTIKNKTTNEVFTITDRCISLEYYHDINHLHEVKFSEQDNLELVEQKHAEKVEPKFHEGDWVVSPNCVYWHINKISNNRYEVTADTGERANWSLDTNIYHKFTIQDAKDGDVLSDGTTIFIFKDLLSDGSVMSYCDYDTDSGESDAFCPLSVNLMCSKITPAIKEQREQLEKAMADAGYRWNPDEKKMEKIEQKPAWSEEDESILNALLINLKKSFEYNEEGYLKYESWIKLHCQPHHCSYNPYKVAIESIAEMCKHYGITSNSDLQDFYQNVKVKCKDAKEYDNMNPQSHWKPSDEQMMYLSEAIDVVTRAEKFSIATALKELREQLNKLREE